MSKPIHISGKRKTAIARATIKAGNGIIRINSQLLDTMEPRNKRLRIQEPLLLSGDIANKVDIQVNVMGGGSQSQTDAVRLAIAKGLVAFSNSKPLKKTFLEYDRQLLIADVRRKEPCKPNISKARAKRQKSYR